MKGLKFVLSSVALCASLASFSQTDTTKSTKNTSVKTDTTSGNSQHAATGTSVKTDTTSGNGQRATTGTTGMQSTQQSGSQSASNLPKPNFGRYYIAVLGTYQPAQTGGTNQQVTVTGDETNPGKVWVEGLAPAKFYALLKTPGTYKVPAQSQDQNSIAEGTITYDESSKQITICVGCGFSDNGAATATTTTETHSADVTGKRKNAKPAAKAVLNFTGTKVNQGSASAF